MIAFEVTFNGERLTLAGAEDMGVLDVLVTAVGPLGPKAGDGPLGKDSEYTLDVGGMTHRGEREIEEMVRWVDRRPIEIGDEIRVRLFDADVADAPVCTTIEDPEVNDRQLYEYSKRVYFELKDKYELDTEEG